MDGSFPLLMENVSWFQQYQEGSPVAVPNPEAPVCSQHHSAARHSNAPPDDPPPPGERQAQPQRTMALRCPCPSIHDTQRPNIGGAFQLDATGSLVKRHRRLGCGYFGPLSQCCQCCEWRVRDQCSRMPVVTGVHGVVPSWRTTFGSCIVLRQPESQDHHIYTVVTTGSRQVSSRCCRWKPRPPVQAGDRLRVTQWGTGTGPVRGPPRSRPHS